MKVFLAPIEFFDAWYTLTNALTCQAECYHYLFDAAIKLHQLGLDWSTPTHGPIRSVNGVLNSIQNSSTSTKARKVGSDNGTEPPRVSF